MYGTKHLIGLGVVAGLMIIFFLMMHFFVNKRGENARRWALRGICIFLFTLEFLKYIMLLRYDGAIGYGNFPFQLCSMPLYLFPIVAFGKGKVADWVKPAAFCIGLMGGFITLMYPSNVLYENVSWLFRGGFNFAVISFLYHATMVVFAVYMIVGKLYKPMAFDFVKSLSIIFGLSLVAIALNAIIPGADYFMLGKGYGSPLNFIIGEHGLFVYILTMIAIAVAILFAIYSFWIIKALVIKIKSRDSIKKASA